MVKNKSKVTTVTRKNGVTSVTLKKKKTDTILQTTKFNCYPHSKEISLTIIMKLEAKGEFRSHS